MEKELTISGSYSGKLIIEHLPCVNYAMVLNNNRVFSKFVLINDGGSQLMWDDVRVTITGEMFCPCELTIPQLQPGHVVNFENANLIPVTSKLMSLTEAVSTGFVISIYINGTRVMQQSESIVLMAFDQWHGSTIMPELIAAFVTPNHPCIPTICKRAAMRLEEMSGRGDLDEYLSADCGRVMNQVECVYNTLLDEQITYCVAPPSFEDYGQRIRLVDKVMNDKLGNCIELSLLMCACFESIGINTVLLMFEGHTMVGVWLDPCCSVQMVCYDSNTIAGSISHEDRELVLIEATSLTRGESLATAIAMAEGFFNQHAEKFEYCVDIHAARINRIRPLPQYIYSDVGWEINDDTDYDVLFDQLANRNPYDIHGTASNERIQNKLQLWERKLLDLSLRNNLLNMKSGKRIVPLKEIAIDDILEHLKSEKLADDIDEKDPFATTKELYRAARTSIEENGANSLFLSVGTLRWHEENNPKSYFAPLMFLPIEIVRHGAKNYVIRPRDEEPMMNITLLEMMRQTFELEVPALSPIPENENEMIDWRRVFGILNTIITQQVNKKRQPETQWQICEECMIGLFSFTKFVMWHDIHSNPQVLERHPLLHSLMLEHLDMGNQDDDTDVRQLDHTSQPSENALPVDVDSSQLQAVVNASKGNTFILYGPPGTGKSQTITNMIANALYHDKRVLFVAEKKAALDVVQDRLKRIGLEPFCLELHSNKVDKKFFLSQIKMALDVGVQASSTEYEKMSGELFGRRQELNAYIEALHCERAEGLSLYNYINRYLDIDGETMKVRYDDVKHLTIEQANDIYKRCVELDTIIAILGQHPGQHPLLGLYPKENTADNQRQTTEAISRLPLAIRSAKKKEEGWMNRWFLKRSALDILSRSGEWNAFFKVAETDRDIKEDMVLFESSVDTWNQHTDLLRLWYHYSLRAEELMKYDVEAVLDYYLQGHTGTETADAFLKGFYQALAKNIMDNDPAMRSFNGLLFKDVIEKYRKLTRQFQEITKEEIVCRLSQRIPQAECADKIIKEEITFLNRRIAANGRAYSVRRMLDQTRHILPKICPCMLMSPLSVAQYLEMSSDQFDLIIFDEASQLPTSEAIGAIARGKSVVVVGDPKQMPPTNFFNANATSSDSDASIDDLESILDDCISISLPGHYLSCHYRSKHESLIAFSNIYSYDNKLITFPSVDNQDRKVTIKYIDGVYDFGKTRSNKLEAKAIVDDVIARLERQVPAEDGGRVCEPIRSIGIVAFSKVQSALIEDMLMDALAHRPELEKIAFKEEEPIFVKNLENVQGDERDIILFSVGYGPDKNGKVSMNFGPLNQRGGERRLNVAVSRARYEMKVFSSLKPQHIDLQRTKAEGVRGLKGFLEYAETGYLPCPSSLQTAEEIDPIVEAIAKDLRAKGNEVHTNVGKSKFKIDLAIVDPHNPMRYSSGIILDGTTYYSTPTARDREIVQPTVLSLLGWNIERKWTADYTI